MNNGRTEVEYGSSFIAEENRNRKLIKSSLTSDGPAHLEAGFLTRTSFINLLIIHLNNLRVTFIFC